MNSEQRKRQEQTIQNWRVRRKKEQAKWLEDARNGVFQAACDKPDFRTEAEIHADFLKNGFQ